MTRQMAVERPTANLRFIKRDNRFILQQSWEITWRDDDTQGNSRPQTHEWRDIPLSNDSEDSDSKA